MTAADAQDKSFTLISCWSTYTNCLHTFCINPYDRHYMQFIGKAVSIATLLYMDTQESELGIKQKAFDASLKAFTEKIDAAVKKVAL
jgi:hypothetical protein